MSSSPNRLPPKSLKTSWRLCCCLNGISWVAGVATGVIDRLREFHLCPPGAHFLFSIFLSSFSFQPEQWLQLAWVVITLVDMSFEPCVLLSLFGTAQIRAGQQLTSRWAQLAVMSLDSLHFVTRLFFFFLFQGFFLFSECLERYSCLPHVTTLDGSLPDYMDVEEMRQRERM